MKGRLSMAPLVYVALLMTPVYWLLVMSFKTNAEIGGGLTFLPHAVNLENYALIFSDPDWYMGYVNAVIYVLLNVAISVMVALPAAYAFSRHDFFGHRGLFFGLLMFRMMAPAILLAPFVQIFSDLGLIDTHIAVAIAHCFFNVPLAIWILEGFISAIPREMDESARIDGHGILSFMGRILIPQIAPGIAVAAFFCFMFSWIEYMLANALTTIDAKPIAGIMTRAAGVMTGDLALLSAASVLGLLPGLILIIFMRKYLATGFSMGRVL
ncbi:carbohydrate ABC transporter permease [Aestuariivirga litoralis]|uniref:Carbohydrate ABC transporter permease n=1 Tax=Aestuariivirga litoralis TaxID=2650924 RepID=A0A2W2BF99_9HYPH|nr:carbohydrate ABC transporter permease [Aestuariivirga litoralis]PZF78898.1 carbohydrate ABC transporter permease [Aestuariivirga litoralis]